MAPILVTAYDPTWPVEFEHISLQIKTYLVAAAVPYITIEHVGSTSVPHLPAKPNIDLVILVKTGEWAEKARDALIWEPTPDEYYKCIGNGGIKGRFSMKHQDWERMPQRSVYIISEEDEDGMLGLRGYRSLREVLTSGTRNGEALKKEYGNVKLGLVREGIEDGVEYGRRKNEVIRKILRHAGWTDEEVGKKEALDVREIWPKFEL